MVYCWGYSVDGEEHAGAGLRWIDRKRLASSWSTKSVSENIPEIAIQWRLESDFRRDKADHL